MKLIPLTKGQFAKVDDEDFDELMKDKWVASYSKITKSYYAQREGKKHENKVNIKMHRQIMKTPKGMDCDHWDHDTLNNQKSNLRNCTRLENNRNRNKPLHNNKLGELGIQKRSNGKFRVRIRVDGKLINVGTFVSIEEARAKRDESRCHYFGEFSGID